MRRIRTSLASLRIISVLAGREASAAPTAPAGDLLTQSGPPPPVPYRRRLPPGAGAGTTSSSSGQGSLPGPCGPLVSAGLEIPSSGRSSGLGVENLSGSSGFDLRGIVSNLLLVGRISVAPPRS